MTAPGTAIRATPGARTSTAGPSLHAVHRMSHLCAAACLVLAAALPVATLAFWALADEATLILRLDPNPRTAGLHFPDGLSDWQRLAAAALTLLPVGLLAAGLLSARRCLRSFADGAFFTADAIRALRGFARAVFWSAAAGVALPTLLGLVLTAGNPVGQRALVIGIGSDQMLGMLIAGVLWVIAGALAQAAAIAEDHALVI